MKSMRLPLVPSFYDLFLQYRGAGGGGATAPLAPPRSATTLFIASTISIGTNGFCLSVDKVMYDTLESLLPPANEVWGKVIFSQASVCPQGSLCLEGGPCPGGLCPGVSVWGFLSRGSLSRGLCSGGLCQGGLCQGGLCQGGSLFRRSLSGGSLYNCCLSENIFSRAIDRKF